MSTILGASRYQNTRDPARTATFQTVSRNCLVNGETLLKRCILAMTRSAKWARTALSGTCRAFFGAYRGFAKQSLETVLQMMIGELFSRWEATIGVLVPRRPGGRHAAHPPVSVRPHRRGVGPARAASIVFREARPPVEVARPARAPRRVLPA